MNPRTEYVVYRGLAGALRVAPAAIAYGGANLLGEALHVGMRNRAHMVRRHLRRVLGPDIAERDLDRWVRRAFLSYGRYWADAARVELLKGADVDALMTTEGLEGVFDIMRGGRGVVMALAHLGSWELGGAWLTTKGFPMTAVVEVLEPPELFEWFVAQRRAVGIEVIPLGAGVMAQLVQVVRAGGLVGLLCDRDISGTGVEVEFFGETTTLPGGPALIALRTGAALVCGAVYATKPQHAHLVSTPPIEVAREGRLQEDVQRITQAVTHQLEDLIRRAPEQWHLLQPNWPSDREA